MIEINYNEYKETIADNMKLIQENHKLKEIIKEVREYIENDIEVYYVLDTRLNKAFDKTKKVKKELLEILDKVDKENNNEDN